MNILNRLKAGRPSLLAVALIALINVQAQAADAPETTPGLWEMTMDMGGEMDAQMKQAMEAMANMSPQEREMMQNMMSGMGIQMTKPNAIQICVTPEDAAKKELQMDDLDGCTQKVVEQTSKKLRITFQCPDSSGDATVTFQGTKAYSTVINGQMKTDAGMKDFRQTVQAKWIQSDCKGLTKPKR